MKIKESRKMSDKDVEKFFDTLDLIGKGMTGTKEESDAALSAFYSLIIDRDSAVAYVVNELVPVGMGDFISIQDLSDLTLKVIDERIQKRMAAYQCKDKYFEGADRSELQIDERYYERKKFDTLIMWLSQRAKYKFCYNVICTQLTKIAKAIVLAEDDYTRILHDCEAKAVKAMGKVGAPLFGHNQGE